MAHRQQRLDKRTPLSVEANADFVEETTASTEQRRPEILERWRSFEFRLFSVRRNRDQLLAALSARVRNNRLR